LGPLAVTNLGAYAARNAVIGWQAGAIGGVSHQGCSEYFDGNIGGGTMTLYIDALNHRVGVGTANPAGPLSMAAVQNIDFGNWSFLGQTGSQAGTLVGWNAQASPGSVTEKVIAAQASAGGFRFLLLTGSGIRFHASSSAVTAAQDVTAVGEKLLIDDVDDVTVLHKLKAPGLGPMVGGEKYLVVDANGHVHVSAIGPAS
jgi:hypothetical protein